MTPRPTFRPSSTGPRLPISVDPDGRVSNHTRPLPIPSPSPSNDTEGYTPILEIPPRVRRTPSTLESEQFWDRHRPEYTRSVSSENRHRDRQRQRQRQRIWEEDIPHPSRPRSGISSTSSANMMLPASAQHTPHHANMDGYFPSIGIRPRVDFQPFHPPPAQPTRPMTAANPTQHVMPISEAPRHSNGAKKQQSGRKRTACDRCKRQKSSCVEAFIEDPTTGMRRTNPRETRCQRCVERRVSDCTITNAEASYARPPTPSPRIPALCISEHPIVPELPKVEVSPTEDSTSTQRGYSPVVGALSAELVVREDEGTATIENPPGVSPGSENQSQASGASTFWKTLFEEDASIRTKRGREDSPKAEVKQQGRVYFGNSHMGPSFVQEFVNATRDETSPRAEVSTLPKPLKRPQRPDYRAEKLLKNLPGNEKEMDRYVDRFLDKYNFWADVIDETDFRAMYTAFKQDHCFGTKADRAAADLRDLSLLFMVLAFAVVLDHTPAEEVTKQNQAILATIPEGEARDRAEEALMAKDAASMTLNRREEMSAFWMMLAKSSLLEVQAASVGETINSISAWVLVAWYAIHGRKAEEGWSVLGQAARQAMASGFHIDGSHRMYQLSGITAKEKEQRRRVWSHMVIIDTSVSLYLGRPHAIFGGQRYTSQEPANIAGDELKDPTPVKSQLVEDAADVSPWQLDLTVYPEGVRGHPLFHPTRSTFLILHLRLAYVIGRMQLQCFGHKARKHEKDVVECEAMFESWAQALPPHFKIKGTDHSLDHQPGYEWLRHQRKNLHSKYYIARISLHRPYLLAADAEGEGIEGGPNLYESSQDACMLSAVADLNLRTQADEADPLDRFKWITVASGFNPALIMGIVCFFNAQHHKYQVQELLGLLSKYLEEEQRALKFLHKSARVHVKLEQRQVDAQPTAAEGSEAKGQDNSENKEGLEAVSEPEKEKERAAKRTRYSRPFTTSAPLQLHVHPAGEVHAGSSRHADAMSLPPAHPSAGPQTPSTASTYLAPPNGNGLGTNVPYSQSPFQAYPHVPSALQYAIKDFSFGDQDLTTFTDFSLPVQNPMYSSTDITRSLSLGNAPLGHGHIQHQNQNQFDTFGLGQIQNFSGIAPTPSPNTDAAVWDALQAMGASNSLGLGTTFGQVLSNMDNAGAQIGELSPPSSLGDLPGSNAYSAWGYYDPLPAGQGHGVGLGLGIQLGHVSTPMHGGTVAGIGYGSNVHPDPHAQAVQQHHQPMMQHPQPHTHIQQPMRRQSYPLPQGHMPGHGWQ